MGEGVLNTSFAAFALEALSLKAPTLKFCKQLHEKTVGCAGRQDLLAWEVMLSSLVSSPGTDSQHPISCQALPDTRMLMTMGWSQELTKHWEISLVGRQPQHGSSTGLG